MMIDGLKVITKHIYLYPYQYGTVYNIVHMCGRYFFTHPDEFFERYDLSEKEFKRLSPNYNIAPGQQAPIVVHDEKGNHLKMARWGLIPFWAKDPKVGYKMFNARMETLDEKPTWRKPFLTQRALVPASGFYEWRKEGNQKQPYAIRPRSTELISFAGLYDTWKDEEGNETLTYSIVTSPANEAVSLIHDRMPVILDKQGEDAWSDPDNSDPALLEDVLRDDREDDIETYPVSRKVNKSGENDPSLIEEKKE
jgi:putative SOS response-associated peptidase YedK